MNGPRPQQCCGDLWGPSPQGLQCGSLRRLTLKLTFILQTRLTS